MIIFKQGDQIEPNLWVQWGSIYMNTHKMQPEEACRMADIAIEEWRKRQGRLETVGPGTRQ